jgi:hypothetical protein
MLLSRCVSIITIMTLSAPTHRVRGRHHLAQSRHQQAKPWPAHLHSTKHRAASGPSAERAVATHALLHTEDARTCLGLIRGRLRLANGERLPLQHDVALTPLVLQRASHYLPCSTRARRTRLQRSASASVSISTIRCHHVSSCVIMCVIMRHHRRRV